MKWLRTGVLALAVTGMGLGLASCTEDDDDTPTIVGKWQWVSGTDEELLELKSNGSGLWVFHDNQQSTCNYLTFNYTIDSDSIYITNSE